MHDDVLINEAATIERCMVRAREEYFGDPATFERNFTRQGAAILNIQRACEAALGMGHHLIARDRLSGSLCYAGVTLLAQAGRIARPLAEGWQRMVGFRKIAVHDDQRLLRPITIAAIERQLGEFLNCSQALLQHHADV